MTVLDEIYAYGHENIIGTHRTTIEITRDKNLTRKGICIIGTNATKACFDLNPILKEKIRGGKRIKITLKVENLQDSFYGYGSKELKLVDKEEIVFRKSNFISDRTMLVNCTKASKDINPELIEKMKISGNRLSLIFEINEINEKE
jgi:hypothetical protein